jgi:hydrogenase maturation protein HypF
MDPEIRRARLHITGIVQGVGFRPFVYSLADRFALAGWVRNTSAGVDIEVDGSPKKLEAFVAALKSEVPPLARIDKMDLTYESAGLFSGFKIITSEEVEGSYMPISPDVGICPDCLHELFNSADRRYRYPFINCTNCGPRFTIITNIPYDRPNTTMAPFKMCPACMAEYIDPLNRRFHAQPVACPECGPKVWIEWQPGSGREGVSRDEAIQAAQKLLADGGILAVKGLGGFHLACNARNTDAVTELRNRKLRVDKPFALMMADLITIQNNCQVNRSERQLLESRQRPIVVLEKKPGSSISTAVAPRQDSLGIMLPYTPLHYLLLNPGGPLDALVMTSGNLSEEPIATGNDEARDRLTPLADAFLMHNREIHTRCDDSVLRAIDVFKSDPPELYPSENSSHSYFLRRSRGFAPDPLKLPFETPSILATGGELKNTFCLTRERYAFISHHIGDMENFETLQSFEDGIAYYERLFRIQPKAIAYDLHPDYLSTRYALERGGSEQIPLVGVQHHHAHIASCMADNGLDGAHPVIGVAFDGTGFGEDGAIWGGEFLVGDFNSCKRKFHFAYFPLPGGDACIKQPARIALAMLWSLGIDWDERLAPVKELSTRGRIAMRTQLEKDLNIIQSSSMGRIFDAFASLAGVRQNINYEAQAAIEFESELDENETGAYQFEIQKEELNTKPAIENMLVDIYNDVPIPVLSARFHNGVAKLVSQTCNLIRHETALDEIALSGGVWQNLALLKRTVRLLRDEGFTVYCHHQVPTNDGGLSLGQALIGAVRIMKAQ